MSRNEQSSGYQYHGRRDEPPPPIDNNSTTNSGGNHPSSRPMQQQIGVPAGVPQQVPAINNSDPNVILAATSALGMLVGLPGSASVLAQLLQTAAARQQQYPIAAPPPQQQISTSALPGQQTATFAQGGTFPSVYTMRAAPAPESMAYSSSMPAAAMNTTATAASAHLPLQQGPTASIQAATNPDPRQPLPFAESQPTGICIYVDQDELELSPYQCLVRQQIEIFEVPTSLNKVHNEEGQTCQGRNRPVMPGQVGIRCRHCGSCEEPDLRGRGAILFPSTLLGVYQTAQNMANTHLVKTCKLIPDVTRQELLRVRSREEGKQTRKSAYGGGRKYWAAALSVMGVVDTPERRLRFASSMQGNTEASRES